MYLLLADAVLRQKPLQ